MSRLSIKRYGTTELPPEQHRLRAGVTTATLEDGQLRWIKTGEAEAIRGIAFLIRDRDWSTCVPEISNLAIDRGDDAFAVTFDALCRTGEGDFHWHGEFHGDADGSIRCVATGRPDRDFTTARTGFVILHPLAGTVGRPMTVEHTDGSVEEVAVPEAIVPDQPFFLVRAMSHEPMPGVTATVRMEGDAWETEDHRNWTDASLKTYSRPLSLPWPYVIPKGQEVRHSVTLTFSGSLPEAPAREGTPVTVTLGARAGTMPRIGLSLLADDVEAAFLVAAIVREAGPQHLNARLDLRSHAWPSALAAFARFSVEVGAELVLEIILPDAVAPAAALAPVAAAVQDGALRLAAVLVTPAADLKSYPPGSPSPVGVPTWEEVAAEARIAFPGTRLGGGMLSNFTELNRKPPPPGLFDFIAHATSGLVHAADDRSVMETLESIGHIVRSTRGLIGDTPYRIGPSHIGNSFNPYGASVTANPDNRRVTMARVEPRHRGLFGAAWHLGFLSEAAASGVEAATLASPVGEFGIAYAAQPHAQPGFDETLEAKVYPLFHVLKAMAGAAGTPRLDSRSSDAGRVRALAFERDGIAELWLANLRDTDVEVIVEGFAEEADLWRLDEDSFDAAIRNQVSGAAPVSIAAALTLSAFAVARLRPPA